jgi:hypothetical protein
MWAGPVEHGTPLLRDSRVATNPASPEAQVARPQALFKSAVATDDGMLKATIITVGVIHSCTFLVPWQHLFTT